jgi:hypothetical protein
MTPAMILALLEGVLGAAPQLLALFNRATTTGQPVPASDVAAILTQYGIDRAVFAGAIATAEAAQGITKTVAKVG